MGRKFVLFIFLQTLVVLSPGVLWTDQGFQAPYQRGGFSSLLATEAWAQGAAAPAAAPVAGGEVFGPAPVTGSEQPTFVTALMEMLPMLVICYIIFYFMVIKPQDSTAKGHKALIESLKKGDTVLTAGGVVGKVSGTEEGFVLVEIAPNVKVKVESTFVKKRLGDEPKAKAA